MAKKRKTNYADNMLPLTDKKKPKTSPSHRRVENSSMAVKWVFELKKRRAAESLKKRVKRTKRLEHKQVDTRDMRTAVTLKGSSSKNLKDPNVTHKPLPENPQEDALLMNNDGSVSRNNLPRNILDKKKLRHLLNGVVLAQIETVKAKELGMHANQAVQSAPVSCAPICQSIISNDAHVRNLNRRNKLNVKGRSDIPDGSAMDGDDGINLKIIPFGEFEKPSIHARVCQTMGNISTAEVKSHTRTRSDTVVLKDSRTTRITLNCNRPFPVTQVNRKKPKKYAEKSSFQEYGTDNQKPPQNKMQGIMNREKLNNLLTKMSQVRESTLPADYNNDIEVLCIRKNVQNSKPRNSKTGTSFKTGSKTMQNVLDKQKLKNLLKKVSELKECNPAITCDTISLSSSCENQCEVPEKCAPFQCCHVAESVVHNKSSLSEKMSGRLNVARFRFINEQLYTSTGQAALEFFTKDPDAFTVYHMGYQTQLNKWPINPVNIIIDELKKKSSTLVIADFGCGDAKLAKCLSNIVHSFDLVALNEHVVACDMSKVPLENNTVDVVVFCLSLMGTNLTDFLIEANRILKLGGLLKIAEVESRFENVEHFIKYLTKLGFNLLKKNLSHKMFVLFDFKKNRNYSKLNKNLTFVLQPCVYKKR